MSKKSSYYYPLWIAGVTLSLVFFGAALWSGPASLPPVAENALQKATTPSRQDLNKDYDAEAVIIPPFDPASSQYVLTVWSKNGLTQIIDPTPAWSLLPPGTVLEAQLIHRGPDLAVAAQDVTLRYSLDISPQGPLQDANGNPLPRTGTFTLKEGDVSVFTTPVIPAMPYSGKGSFTPYPLVTVEAVDKAGTVLATTRTVLPMSTEMGCKNCHTGDWRVEGRAGMDTSTAGDILRVHDRINNTQLAAQAAAGNAINCTSCHSLENKTGLNLSAAMHGWHAAYMGKQGAEACASCHPSGPHSVTQFGNDLHAAKGLDCTRCHGFLEDHAISLLNHESSAGKATAQRLAGAIAPRLASTQDKITPRIPRVNMPSCASCHDFTTKPSSETASAFNKWTKNETELFSNSVDDSGQLRCSACHGASHALYPVENPFGRNRSNIPPVQHQQVAAPFGAFGNCAVCHNTPMDVSMHHPIVELPTRSITAPQGALFTRPRAVFPHAGHARLDCKSCHHTGFVDGKPLACAQEGCHGKLPGPGVSPEDPLLFRNAFHGAVRGCQPCHLEMRSQGKASGPVQCRACHIGKD